MPAQLRTAAAVLLVGGLLTALQPAAHGGPTARTDRLAATGIVEPTTGSPTPHGVELDHDAVLPPAGAGKSAARIQKYPGKVIRYWADVPKSYRWAVDTAAAAWNRTGLDMTFKPSSRARSDLTIEVDNIGFEGGLATLGYAPRRYRWVKLSPGMMSPGGFGGGLTVDERRLYTMHIAAHELGHTLGLDHRSVRCGLMGPILWIGECKVWTTDPGFYSCQVVDDIDLGRAVRLYGGRRTLAPESCPLDPLPPPLPEVTFEGSAPEGGPARISWVPPVGAPRGTEVQVLRRAGSSCDFDAVGDRTEPPRFPGAVSVTEVALDAGPVTVSADGEHCFGVRAVNASGAGALPTTEVLTLNAAPPEAPDATAVVHLVNGNYRITIGEDLPTDQDLLALVRPQGQCAPASWPDEADPGDHYAYSPDDDGNWEIGDDGVPRACVTVYAIDRRDRIGPGVSLQAPAAPTPPKPDLDDVSLEPVDEAIRFHTAPLDEDRFVLVAVVSDACHATWDPELEWEADWPWYESGWWYVWYYEDHPCLSLFVRNADNVYSAGTTFQL